MKNKIYLLTIFLLGNLVSYSQAPIWQWVKAAGGALNEGAFSVTVDNNGNSYITGSFESPTLTFGTFTLTNHGNSDVFIAKFSPTGDVLWAQSAGGTGYEGGIAITSDASANIYVTGFFASPTITFGTTILTTAGGDDVFIVKLTSAGTVVWAKRAGGINNDDPSAISVDATSNVYITGYYRSATLAFGTTTLTNTDNSGNSDDIFVTKYDPSGNALWAKSGSGTKDETGAGIKTDAAGNVYVTGYFYTNGFTIGTVTLTNTDVTANSDDIFIIKYDATGNILWVKKAGGFGYDDVYSIAVEPNGNFYITGSYGSPNLIIGSTMLTNVGLNDLYILKYNTSGNLIWAKNFGDVGNESANTIVSDNKGNIYITGFFDSFTITFGATVLTNLGDADLFVSKLDSAGTVIWAKSAGGTGADLGNGLAVNGNGILFLAGMFRSPTVNFGGTSLTNVSNNKLDVFTAKLGGTTGMMQQEHELTALNIFPNPGNGILHIECEDIIDAIQITDVYGKLIFSACPNERNFVPTKLGKGIYFVTTHSGEMVTTKKIIVKDE